MTDHGPPPARSYVADTLNDRIQVFNAAGQFVRAWGGSGRGPG